MIEFLLELHLFIIFCEILFIFAIIHMISKKRSATSMVAWLLGMLLLPYIIVPAYFVFGMRKVKRKSNRNKRYIDIKKVNCVDCEITNSINTTLNSNNSPKVTNNNSFKLYSDGISAYNSLINCIEEAQESIYLSTYVFANDEMTHELLKKLIQKAKSGVSVKILIDGMGSLKVYFKQSIFKDLIKSGGDVKFFMPILKMPFRNYINLRNHRKIYLFDEKIVLTGGMNLGNEYLGFNENTSRWEDLLFKIQGSSVDYFSLMFIADWEYATRKKIQFQNLHIKAEKIGNTELQVVPSGPDVKNDSLYEGILAGIHTAKSKIWIVTPYFIPSEPLIKSLIVAKHRGVDVRLITPVKSNQILADLARSGYMKELDNAGVKIELYQGEMLHAKAVLFDNDAVMLGSVNLDNRSLFLNYEVAVFSYDNVFINDISKWMETLISNSSNKLKKTNKLRELAENFIKMLSPVL